ISVVYAVGDLVTISGGPYRIQSYQFAHGTTLSSDEMAARAPYYLVGTPGDDYLFTGPANDTLIGGRGNDYLAGDLGDDTYLFNVGDGADQIFDYGGNDTLRFGPGI